MSNYVKTDWVDGSTPLNATNMNHIEDGIESVDQALSGKANSSDLEGHLVNVAPSVDEDYKVNLLKGKNLFDSSKVISNYNMTSSGTMEVGTGYNLYIVPIKPNTNYIMSIGSARQWVYGFYTSYPTTSSITINGQRIVNTTTNETFTTPSNANFMCIREIVGGGGGNEVITNLMLNEGNALLPYEPFVQKSIQVDGTKFTDTLNVGTSVDTSYKVNVLYSKNLFDINNINLRTGYILNDSGTEISDTTGGYTRNYSEVNTNTEYILSGLQIGNGNRRIYYYDANKNFLSRSSLLGGDVTSYTFTTPANCKYVNFQIHTTIDTNLTTWNLQKTPYVLPSIYVDGEDIYKQGQNEVYSTSEHIIGKWIDGKPLYRKVFTITSLTGSNTNLVDVSGLSIDFVKISGTIITSTGAKFPINLYDSASNYSVIIISDVGYIRGRGAIGSGTLSKCIVILEYTKTTD